MPLIREMILYHATSHQPRSLSFDDSDPAIQALLRKINRKQRNRWRKEEIVPLQVLEVLWIWGIRFSDSPPTHGLELDHLLENLWNFFSKCNSDQDKATADYIYKDTVIHEKGLKNNKSLDKSIYCLAPEVPILARNMRIKFTMEKRRR